MAPQNPPTDKPGGKGKGKGKGKPGAKVVAGRVAGKERGLRRDALSRLSELLDIVQGGMPGSDLESRIALARSLFPDYGGGVMGPGALRRQARTDVNSIIQPQLAAIRKLYGQRSEDMAQAFGHYFPLFADRMAGYAGDLEQTQAGALAGQQQADSALAAFLRDRGQGLASTLGSDMAAINAPDATVAATAGVTGDLAAGSAGQTYALGSSAMDLMRANALSANTLARKAPIRAEQLGRDQLFAEQRLLSSRMQEDLDEIQGRVPQLAYDVLSKLGDRSDAALGRKAQRAQSIMEFASDAERNWFNRYAAAAGIAKELVSGYGGAEGIYADIYGGTSGGGGAGDDDDPLSVGDITLNIIGQLEQDPFFKKVIGPTGDVTGPSAASRNPRRASIMIANRLRAAQPGWSEERIRTVRNKILRTLGIKVPGTVPRTSRGPTSPTGDRSADGGGPSKGDSPLDRRRENPRGTR